MPIYEYAQDSQVRKVFFIHIPKCAGSYLEKVLAEKYSMNQLFSKNMPKIMNVVPQHLTYDEIISLNIVPKENDFAFAIVRDPYQRAESEFFYQRRVYKIKYSEKGFSKWLLKSMAKTKKDPYHMKSHFRPQSDFLGKGVVTYKLEDGMDAIIQGLESELGTIAANKDRVNSGERKEVVWTDQAVKAFNKFYAEDFKTLGYSVR